MPITTLIAGILLSPQATKVYEAKEIDLKFSYPDAWKLRKERLYDILEFNVDGQLVKVQIMKTVMTYPKEHWQQVMKEVNSQSGRVLLKQWEEELLGVPLLLTRYNEGEGTSTRQVLSGLLYGARDEKLNFRLTSPEPVAEGAQKMWFDVMLGMSTVSGRMPGEKPPKEDKPEKPKPDSRNPEADDPVRRGEGRKGDKTYVLKPIEQGPPKIELAPKRVVADAGRGIYAYMPEAWALESDKIVHSSGTAIGFTAMTGDQNQVKKEYLRAGSAALAKMDKVTDRQESKPGYNAAGFVVSEMSRSGTSATGNMASWTAYGWSAGYGWVLSWTGTPEELAKLKPELSALAGRLSLGAQ